MEEQKEIVIGENTYIIGKYSAQIGSFLLMRLMRVFREFIRKLQSSEEDTTEKVNEPEDFTNQLIQTLLMDLEEKDFENVQRHALNVVSRIDYVNGKPFNQPIILRNGTFAFADLSLDVSTVMALTSQSLFFNLSPFFSKTGLNAMMKGEVPASKELVYQL